MCSREPPSEVLLVRAHRWLCALRLDSVIETFRPLPIKRMARAPSFVRGVAIVRGEPTPVINVASLLGDEGDGHPHRFVTVRAGGRAVALEVDEVIGVRAVPRAVLGAAPPLLGDAVREHVDTLGALDDRLLAVLNAAQLLPVPAAEATAALEGA